MDSGESRIARIVELIGASKYSIHDLSRMQADEAGEFARLNMPFELGMDMGCRSFGSDQQRSKKSLILEKERYRYQRALSDLSNSDIASHDNQPQILVGRVRDWINNVAGTSLPGASQVWFAFNEFMADDYDSLRQQGYSQNDIERIPVPELVSHMRAWVSARQG